MHLVKKAGLLFAAMLVVPSASSQVNLNFVSTDLSKLNAEQTDRALSRLGSILARYNELTDSQKKIWDSRIEDPCDFSKVPLERSIVDFLYEIVQSQEELGETDAAWNLRARAWSILVLVQPESERSLALARDILKGDLPAEFRFLPHENMFRQALFVLIKSEDESNVDFALSAERPEFWGDRASQMLLGINNAFRNCDDASLLTLRFMVPFLVAKNRPDLADDLFSNALLMSEDQVYRTELLNLKRTLAISRTQPTHASQQINSSKPPSPWLRFDEGNPLTPFEMTPVLDFNLAESTMPDLDSLRNAGLLVGGDFRLCMSLSVESNSENRIAICRELSTRNNLPFLIKRWFTCLHILSAAELNLIDEMEDVASNWLLSHPNEIEELPSDWIYTHPFEVNTNVYIRAFLAHTYRYVVNDAMKWSATERLAKLSAVMEPLVYDKSPDVHLLVAKLYYADSLEDIASKAIADLQDSQHASDLERITEIREAVRAKQNVIYEDAKALLLSVKQGLPDLLQDRGLIMAPDFLLKEIVARESRMAEPTVAGSYDHSLPEEKVEERFDELSK